jgi:hypothetical protein
MCPKLVVVVACTVLTPCFSRVTWCEIGNESFKAQKFRPLIFARMSVLKMSCEPLERCVVGYAFKLTILLIDWFRGRDKQNFLSITDFSSVTQRDLSYITSVSKDLPTTKRRVDLPSVSERDSSSFSRATPA